MHTVVSNLPPHNWGTIDDTTEMRGHLKAERLEDHVRKVLASAPPLTASQRDTIMAAFAGFAPAVTFE